MFSQSEIEDFRQYRRGWKPGSSTAVHYSSDVHIFSSGPKVAHPTRSRSMTWIGSSFGRKAMVTRLRLSPVV